MYTFVFDYFTILLVTLLCIVIVRIFINKWPFIQVAVKLPGPWAYPIVGNALNFACRSDQLLDRIVGVTTPFADVTPMRLWMGCTLYIIITEPRDIKIILNSEQASKKGSIYKFLHPFIGDGLISGSGKTWKNHRKIMSHIMNQRTLNVFVESFDRHSKHLINKLKPLADGEIFDILHYIEGCTTDIVCETVMGYTNFDPLNNPSREFLHYISQMYNIIHNRMMKIWLHPDWMFRLTSHYTKQCKAKKVIRNFTELCIKAKRQDMTKNKIDVSILQKLLTINDITHEMSDEQLKDEIYTMYVASQDTMTVTSSFTILMLGIHKNIQDIARAEVDMVFGDGNITAESLFKLKYLEMVIKETLRLFPIAPLIVRQLTGELKLENCTLPKNCEVVVAAFITHRSPKHWNNPKKFNPEHFTTEETSNRHSYAFIPFSGGSMSCIGQKYAIMALKTILANLLQSYIIDSNINPNNIKLKTDISIRLVNGYNVSLKSRNRVKK